MQMAEHHSEFSQGTPGFTVILTKVLEETTYMWITQEILSYHQFVILE